MSHAEIVAELFLIAGHHDGDHQGRQLSVLDDRLQIQLLPTIFIRKRLKSLVVELDADLIWPFISGAFIAVFIAFSMP